MGKKILIALGGNALLQSGEKGTAEEQIQHVEDTCEQLLRLIKEGHVIALTHGNGPQVGSILLKNEMTKDTLPPMPLDICGSESQGFIGYMLQRVFHNHMKKDGIDHPALTIVTQTLVDSNDPAFQNPTKPIGPFYTKEEAEVLKQEKKWTMVEQIGKGFRRVVPSPLPIDIVEGEIIKELFQERRLVISCGGGGIPVVKDAKGNLIGIEAVIDKDRTAACLAKIIDADVLMILTDVEKVALNFGKPDQQNLDKLTVEEAKRYLKEGQFAKGSMGPKVEAAMSFIENGGKRAIITSLDKAFDAVEGKTGTSII
ncbi:MAG TPA: carbamate kinase [Chlamydiales bacterium]|nr:carbamate kinase [Chlamydiales bacterium]